MCFSLRSSLLALAVNWLSCSWLWYENKDWNRWQAGFGFFLGIMQVVDTGLWYAHEVDGESFEDCTRRNQIFTAIGVADIHFQALVMFVCSWSYRKIPRKVWLLEVAAISVYWLSFALLTHGPLNECSGESEVYYCSNLSPQRTIKYGWGKDKWGTNRCLRAYVFWGKRISDTPFAFHFWEFLLISYTVVSCEHSKRVAFLGPLCALAFLGAQYFGSSSSVWCLFASWTPPFVVVSNWLFRESEQNKAEKVE